MTLANSQAEFHPRQREAATDPRKVRYDLRNTAGSILAATQKRVAKCGHRLVGPQASIVIGPHGARITGVETCGSVWACPVCAAKISEGRRQEVAECLDRHVTGTPIGGEGVPGDVYMALFTLPHTYTETCAELRVIMRSAWTFFLQGKAWKAARKRWGITGYIRAMEVTHGANGWHPHLHVLFLTSALSESDADELRVWIGERWANVVKRISGKEVRLGVGFGFQKACSVSAAGDYVAKWGADSEIAKASSKVSRKGGRSPWQLLADAGNGDHRARFLFAEYAAAMKGSRHLTWSVGLRDMYLSEPEKDDYELACDDAPHHGDMVIGALRRGVWHRVCRAGLIPELLNSAEAEGWAGVLALLRAHRLALPEAIYVNRRKQNDLHAS